MYALVWIAFVQILFIVASPLSAAENAALHIPLGIAIFVLAVYISVKVKATGCPARVKRTTVATRNMALVQGVLGLALAYAVMSSVPSLYQDIIAFLHLAVALTILSQVSSTATGYDMWEEKEIGTAPLVAA